MTGINVETVEYNSSSFIVWNVGAEDKVWRLLIVKEPHGVENMKFKSTYFWNFAVLVSILGIPIYIIFFFQTRSLWKQYFQNTQGIIFVVDSNDRDRLVDAKRELHRMLIEVCCHFAEHFYIHFINSHPCSD